VADLDGQQSRARPAHPAFALSHSRAPGWYTADELALRRAEGSEFLKRLFAGPHIVLLCNENAEGAAG
jgi:hypothetical protein